MNITPHQAKYYAHQLLCQKSGDERLSQALFEAQVDLQPHQIDAALFALENPLREGSGFGQNHRSGFGIVPTLGGTQTPPVGGLPRRVEKAMAGGIAGKVFVAVFGAG